MLLSLNIRNGAARHSIDRETSESPEVVSPEPIQLRRNLADQLADVADAEDWTVQSVQVPPLKRSTGRTAQGSPSQLALEDLRDRIAELEVALTAQTQAFQQERSFGIFQRQKLEVQLHNLQVQVGRLHNLLHQPQLPSPHDSALVVDSVRPQHLQDIEDTNEMAYKGRTPPAAVGFGQALAALIQSQSVRQPTQIPVGIYDCAYCHSKNHPIQRCPNNNLSVAERARLFQEKKCFKCGCIGHISKGCPRRPQHRSIRR